jgi:hypothetical protein
MRKEKQLVKVVGTVITGVDGARLETKMGRGIVALKRGMSLEMFARQFLAERGIIQATLNARGEDCLAMSPAMFLTSEPKLVITYVFSQFPLSEIGYYGKDLSKIELFRDFKFLKKVLK